MHIWPQRHHTTADHNTVHVGSYDRQNFAATTDGFHAYPPTWFTSFGCFERYSCSILAIMSQISEPFFLNDSGSFDCSLIMHCVAVFT